MSVAGCQKNVDGAKMPMTVHVRCVLSSRDAEDAQGKKRGRGQRKGKHKGSAYCYQRDICEMSDGSRLW